MILTGSESIRRTEVNFVGTAMYYQYDLIKAKGDFFNEE